MVLGKVGVNKRPCFQYRKTSYRESIAKIPNN